MNPRKIKLFAHFIQEHGLPAGALRRLEPIGSALTSDNDDVRFWAAEEDFRQCAHEDVIATQGFQATCHEGDDLILLAKLFAIRESKPRRRVGTDFICV